MYRLKLISTLIYLLIVSFSRLSKIKANRIMALYLGGFVLILVGLGIIFFYTLPAKSNIIEMIPQKIVFYSHFKPEENTLVFLSKNFKDVLEDPEYNLEIDFLNQEKLLLNEPADLLIVPKGPQSPSKSFLKNYDYYAVFVPEDTSRVATSLKETELFIKKILARFLPQEKEKVLPDTTKVIELIANPERFSFKAEEDFDLGATFHYIKEPGLDFEFVYSLWQGKVFFASSLKNLKKFMSAQKEVPPIFIKVNDLIGRCQTISRDFFFRLRLWRKPLNPRHFPQISIANKFFEGLELRGCLY